MVKRLTSLSYLGVPNFLLPTLFELFDFRIKVLFPMTWNTEHVTFKAVFGSTDLQAQACMTVVSGVNLNSVDCASLLAFWVKKSKQWPIHDTRSVSNTFSFITEQ